jgi:hypothetical protein
VRPVALYVGGDPAIRGDWCKWPEP